MSHGSFGENLTVDGLPDSEVCIGDRYRIGEAEFEVTQPRVTCYRVGLRLGEPELPALLVSHHRPGFYMRVIREGHIQAGDRIVRTRTGPGALSVADADALLYLPGRDPAKLRLALQIPALSPGWQGSFRDLLAAEGDSAAATPPLGAEPAPRPRPAWAGFRPLRVTKVVPETATVSSIYLTAPDGSLLPAARAGQYLTLRIPGAGQPAPVRSYSLSSAPDAGTYRISVKQEPRGTASSYLHRNLQPGAVLDVAAPAATSSWTTAPVRSCSSPRASASPRYWPCCTSSRRPAASARSGGCTGARTARTSVRGRGTRPAGIPPARPRTRVLPCSHAPRTTPRPRHPGAPDQRQARRARRSGQRARLAAAHSATAGVLPSLKSTVSGSVPVTATRFLIRSGVTSSAAQYSRDCHVVIGQACRMFVSAGA